MSSLQRANVPTAKELPSYVLNCPETQVTTLPNGLRVASEVRYVVLLFPLLLPLVLRLPRSALLLDIIALILCLVYVLHRNVPQVHDPQILY